VVAEEAKEAKGHLPLAVAHDAPLLR
jgi:hypothetical protein